MALGGTYIPGLRILTDNIPNSHVSRATALYTSSYYLAAGLSYFLTLNLEPVIGWQTTIMVCALGPFIAFCLASVFVPSPPRSEQPPPRLLDFGPVIKNRRAVGFSLLYAIHNAELMAFTSWLIPFLIFSQGLHGIESSRLELGAMAALISIVALPASIIGNEIAHKVSRQILGDYRFSV